MNPKAAVRSKACFTFAWYTGLGKSVPLGVSFPALEDRKNQPQWPQVPLQLCQALPPENGVLLPYPGLHPQPNGTCSHVDLDMAPGEMPLTYHSDWQTLQAPSVPAHT